MSSYQTITVHIRTGGSSTTYIGNGILQRLHRSLQNFWGAHVGGEVPEIRRVLTISPDDEPELLVHATVALLARDIFDIRELEEYALGELKFQLHCWSSISLFEGIQMIYTTQKKAARQLFVTEVIRSYPQSPQLAEALPKAAREIGEFAIDLVALGNVLGQIAD